MLFSDKTKHFFLRFTLLFSDEKNQKIGPIACFSSSYTSLCTLQPAFQPRSIFDYRIMQIITWTVLTSCVITSIIVPTTSVVLQPDPRIVELLQQAELSPDSAAIVSIEQSILDILLAVGLAWQGMKILCRHVGVHSSNRYGFGVSWSKMHRLGHKIMRLGFSWDSWLRGSLPKSPSASPSNVWREWCA